MMFKKGSFEIGGTIYPVSIKVQPMDEIVYDFDIYIYLFLVSIV